MVESMQINSAKRELLDTLQEYSRLLHEIGLKSADRRSSPIEGEESESDEKDVATKPDKRQQRDVDDYDLVIPSAAHHEYFDGLINHLLVDGEKAIEREPEDKSKKRKLEEENELADKQKFEALQEEILPFIQTENAYRLGGITAFPVNDPNGTGERLLGLRFDIFDRVLSKYTIPHYIILKKELKNDNWFIFKTTLPRYIPLVSISFKWLNSDLSKFVSEVRKHLILTLEKSCIFRSIAKELPDTSSMSSDLDYSKIRFNILKKVEILVFCNMSEVTNVIVTPLHSDYPMSYSVKNRLELLLKGRIDRLGNSFVEVLRECDL